MQHPGESVLGVHPTLALTAERVDRCSGDRIDNDPPLSGTFNPMSLPPLPTPVFTIISVTRTLLQRGLSGPGLGVHIASCALECIWRLSSQSLIVSFHVCEDD